MQQMDISLNFTALQKQQYPDGYPSWKKEVIYISKWSMCHIPTKLTKEEFTFQMSIPLYKNVKGVLTKMSRGVLTKSARVIIQERIIQVLIKKRTVCLFQKVCLMIKKKK